MVSSLSSINSYGSERSLNLSDMANNAKMSKLLKIFEGKRSTRAYLMRPIFRVFSRHLSNFRVNILSKLDNLFMLSSAG